MDLAVKLGLPVATAAAGWLGAAARFVKKIATYDQKITALETLLDNTRRAWRLELDTHKQELEIKLRELEIEFTTYENRFERFRDSAVDFAKDAELAKFMIEVQEQWVTIHRTLGQIEGMMRTESLPISRRK